MHISILSDADQAEKLSSACTMSARRLQAAPALGTILFAFISLSLPASANTSFSSPSRPARGVASDTAFCQTLSPRLNGKMRSSSAKLRMTITDHSSIADQTPSISSGPSFDSPGGSEIGVVSTPRKHLGPTAEEIIAQRRQEAQKKKSEVFSNWRYAQPVLCVSCNLCVFCCAHPRF